MTVEVDRGVDADDIESIAGNGLGPEKEGVPFDVGVSGHSKSQETPCFRQLPQVG